MDNSEYYALISPWQVYFDESWQRHYYFNPLNETSSWELPEEIQLKVETFYQQKFEKDEENTEILAKTHVPKKILENPKKMKEKAQKASYLSRPARKQVEQSLATQFAYKQGNFMKILSGVFMKSLVFFEFFSIMEIKIIESAFFSQFFLFFPEFFQSRFFLNLFQNFFFS